MKKRKPRERKISRRQFVKQSALAGIGAAAAGCASSGGLRKIASVISNGDAFDYIVIGSGAGGGPVAANLAREGARQGFTVLLIEAGSRDPGAKDRNTNLDDPYLSDKTKRNYEVPAYHPYAVDDPNLRWDFFVQHYADPKKAKLDSKFVVEKNGILYPRAGTLGGCTAHNAMVTLYPDNKDWDDIANLFNDSSWSATKMRSYYERLERINEFKEPKQRRGVDGWLGVEMTERDVRLKDNDWKLHRIAQAAAGGTIAADITPLSLIKDPNDWQYVMHKYEGAFNIPKATRNGKRNGTRELVLDALKKYPDNFFISTDSLATKLIFDGPENRVVGVEFLQGENLYAADPNATFDTVSKAVRRQVRARREVIVSGGAFNSPQLLMLSGIGPAEELKKHNIPVVHDLPGVGKNLQDRYEIGVVTKMTSPFAVLANCEEGKGSDPCMREFDREPTKSIYSSNGPIVALLKKSAQNRPTPDLCIFALPGDFRGYFPNWSAACMKNDYLTWAILKGHTKNTSGTVTLRSANPLDTPEINFNYFDEKTDPNGEDLAAVLKGVGYARGVNRKQMVKSFLGSESVPAVDGEDLKEFVKRESWGHHASCTNKMGLPSDKMAVVDNKFRVYGTKGLRVVDASVFPRVPGLFIVVPIYMIAEKASEDIIKDFNG